MILWCDEAHEPAENMRRDEALLVRAERAEVDDRVVLRLFAFSPHGITLGRSQEPARILDLERCRQDRVPWAVRPTGGRAIFHAEEWTYALCAPLADADWGGSLSIACGRVARLLLEAFARLGVPAVLAPGARGAAGEWRAGDSARPCFASTSRHEIVRDGRKLVGSAQRRTSRALLQQGSVLLGEGHLRLADYLRTIPADRLRLRESLRVASTHAGDVLGPAPPLSLWADALASSLPAGTRRLEGQEGLKLLTAGNSSSYTPAAP